MAGQNIFFSKTVNSKLLMADKPESGTDKIPVNLEDNRKVFLSSKEPYTAVWGKTIDFLQKNNRPVYIEADADTGTITNVLVPEKDRVWRIENSNEAVVDIAFTVSAVQYHLRRDMPGFEGLLQTLQASLDKNQDVLVTATTDYDIIDVRSLVGSFGLGTVPDSDDIPDVDPKDIKPVSPERAQELFDMLSTCKCSPDLLPDSCITFQVPQNGCWIRAHLMSYKLVTEGETPQKVWCTYSKKLLVAKTPNSRECQVSWIYHVAPIMRVLQDDGTPIDMVFDPSMYNKPVPVTEWQKCMTVDKSTLNTTGWKQYERFGEKATYKQANTAMDLFRIEFEKQCKEFGAPPYTFAPYNCPI